MKIVKEILKPSFEVSEIICNMCGEKQKIEDSNYLDTHITVKKTWGYGSPFDGDTHVIDLCNNCYKNLYDQLKIKPNS